MTCPTCGSAPIGAFSDGSPRYNCHLADPAAHTPIYEGDPRWRADPTGDVILIELSDTELRQAVDCGKLRYDRAMARRARDQFGEPSQASHVRGALGERAFSKWAAVPWRCTTGRYGGAPDVAGCQIRTQSRIEQGVPVHDTDGSGLGYTPVVSVVVLGSTRRLLIRGWLFAREALREPSWRADPGGRGYWAHFCPPERLHPMAEFLDHERVRRAMGR